MSPRVVLSVLILFMSTSAVDAAEWRMDKDASQLHFLARWEGNEVPGVFRDFDTGLEFDPQTPEGGRLEVTVSITSADMDSGDVNEGIAGAEWFNTSRFPRARFTSTEIRALGSDQYEARGVLALKDVERPVNVPFRWSDSGDTAQMSGALTLQRTDFNIGTGEWASGDVIGLDVDVRFELILMRQD